MVIKSKAKNIFLDLLSEDEEDGEYTDIAIYKTKENNMITQQQDSIMLDTATNNKTQKILNGINLILKYQPDAEIQAWEDVGITCGTYSEWIIEVTKMTKEDIEQLMGWGWYGHAGKWRTWTRMYGQR